MLEKIDLSIKMSKEEYEEQIKPLQLRLLRGQLKLRESKTSVVFVFEGWDAAGKGGCILRITEKLDPRGYHVWPISAPNVVEKQYNYLWRFWTRMPEKGQIAIFDRSWYGRVLVERVEGFARKDEWKRAYEEINNFEKLLVDDGIMVVKFWLHISKEEQLRRFKERESNPFKRWKIGPEDWRNREHWQEYEKAAEEMFEKTDSCYAPWHLVSAENKYHARICTVQIAANAIEKATDSKYNE